MNDYECECPDIKDGICRDEQDSAVCESSGGKCCRLCSVVLTCEAPCTYYSEWFHAGGSHD